MPSISAEPAIPEADGQFLASKGLDFSEEALAGWRHFVFHDFVLPPAYTPRTCELLVRLPPGYPNASPDMFWTRPDIRLAATGAWPARADVHEAHGGLTWQRWSRHLPAASWRAGIDNLQTYLAMVRRELQKGL